MIYQFLNPFRVAPRGLDAKVGSFNVSTAAATNTVAVTGVGFTPKLVLFFWSGTTAAGNSLVDTADIQGGFGCATSATDRRADFITADDAADPTASDKTTANDYCIGTHTMGTSTVAGKLDFQSFDADGFTMVVDQQFGVDLRVHYLALAHANLVATCGSFTSAAGTGNQTVSSIGLGGTPTLLFIFGRNLAGTTSAQLHFGATDGTTAWAYDYTDQDANTTAQCWSYLRGGEIRASINAANGQTTRRAGIVSFGSDQFTINWTETAGATDMQFLAIRGISAAVGSSNSAVDNFAVSGLSFAPAAFLLMGHGNAENSADTPHTNAVFSMGAATGTAERRVAYFDSQHNAGAQDLDMGQREDAVMLNTGITTTPVDQIDVQSFNNDGFTLVRDVDGNTSLMHAWVAFGV